MALCLGVVLAIVLGICAALPVGAYSYSQGLEAAVEAGIVKDASSAEAWISDALELVGRFEAPVLWKMMHGEPLNTVKSL